MHTLDSELMHTPCQTAAKCRIPQETEQILWSSATAAVTNVTCLVAFCQKVPVQDVEVED